MAADILVVWFGAHDLYCASAQLACTIRGNPGLVPIFWLPGERMLEFPEERGWHCQL